MRVNDVNQLSISGGKDSTATMLLAIERDTENLSAIFADTGHEHPLTYEYIDYLQDRLGINIQRVKADFSDRIAKKREYVKTKWVEEGVSDTIISAALDMLHPTGVPFLDLCIWKGRFPSRKAKFCTEWLKIIPIQEQVVIPQLKQSDADIYSWQGIRWDESLNRASAVELEGIEPDATRVFAYRPILSWTADDVFAMHRRHGVKWNPLYEQGMGRVGCMPCVNCRKDELRQISIRFPEEIERLIRWESIVSQASKRGLSTFFPAVTDPTASKSDLITCETHGIDRIVSWSKTSRGGRQFDLLATDAPACSSLYGLCG